MRHFGEKKLTFGVLVMMLGVITGVGFAEMPVVNTNETSSLSAPEQKDGHRELVDKRTRYSRTFYNDADKKATLEISGEPLNYQDQDGKWQPIDSSILPDASIAGFDYAATRNEFKVYFSRNAHQPWRFSIRDRWVKFTPKGAQKSDIQVQGNTALYPGVWEEADLKYSVMPSGVKEEIILNGPKAANTFSFQYHLNGTRAQKEGDGSIGFYDVKTGEKVWFIPHAYAYDSSKGEKGPVYAPVSMEMRTAGNNTFLDLTLDHTWLSDPSRVFPVVIDPTVYQIKLDGYSQTQFTPNFKLRPI